jgi:hypothetical protein
MPRVDELKLVAGESVTVGAPSESTIGSDARAAIARAVEETAGIREAHLPQLFSFSVGDLPKPALVLGLEPGFQPKSVVTSLAPKLSAIMPPNIFLDVWPLHLTDPMLLNVRATGCRLFLRPTAKRQWWKVWA